MKTPWTFSRLPNPHTNVLLYHPNTIQEECGFFLTHLCLEGEDGCTRGDAGYDVTMPEPLGDVSGSGYRVRISEVGGDPESVVCSDDFYLMSSVEAQFVAGLGDPKIKVVSPNAESVAFAGREYTVEVSVCVFFGSSFYLLFFLAGCFFGDVRSESRSFGVMNESPVVLVG